MFKDKYVGEVLLVNLPNNLRPRYRWIVSKKDDGKYIARTPKIGVLIRDLKKKRDTDYGSEHVLPKGFTFWNVMKNRTSKKSKKSKNIKHKTKKIKININKL